MLYVDTVRVSSKTKTDRMPLEASMKKELAEKKLGILVVGIIT
jgi:hypothetical protein